MKKLLIALTLCLVLVGCSDQTSTKIESISVKKVYTISENISEYNNYVIVDVRSEAEYKSGHIKNAVNIPLPNINEISISKDKILIVYCRSGSRSKNAVIELQKLGYKKIYNMGGILDWKYELVEGDE